MHLPSLLTLLALAGSGLASPTKRVPGLQVQDLSALLADSNGKLQFAVQDPETQLSDNCTVSWNTNSQIQPGLVPMTPCTQKNFEFGFRYGIGNIENFSLAVKKVNGSQTGYRVVSAQSWGSSWVCTRDPELGVQERCVLDGVLRIDY